MKPAETHKEMESRNATSTVNESDLAALVAQKLADEKFSVEESVPNSTLENTGDITSYEEEKNKREEAEAKKLYDKKRKIEEEISNLDPGFVVKDKTTGAVYDSRSVMQEMSKLTVLPDEKRDQPWELWWAIKKERNAQILLASEVGDTDKVRELLNSKKHGELVADINTKGLDDFTPLHLAVSEVHASTVELLLAKGAQVDPVSTSLRTPLHIACYRGNRQIIMALVKHGANVNAQEKEGNTPTHILAEQGFLDMLAWFLEQKPDLCVKNAFGEVPIEVSANVEIRGLFMQHEKVVGSISSGYSRTVLDNNVILHNNRADMIKLLMFKGQMLTSHSAEPSPQTKKGPAQIEEKKSEPVPLKENKRRRIKIIEAVNELSKTPTTSPEEKIGPEYFEPIQMLGKGSFGEVYLVKYKPTGKLYAMKILNKRRVMSQNLLKYAMTERNVLCFTKHPFIVSLDFAFQTPNRLFLILEYCPGGDLGKMIQRHKRFTEDIARTYAAEVLLGLEDLHKRDIVFRDLKPENIVLDSEGHAMLTDFGLSKEGVTDNVSAKSFCGSIAYLAPEVIKRSGHGKSIDWYLLGLLIYEMLVGVPPYYSSNRDQLFKNIQGAPLKLPFTLSPEAKALIVGLLNRNPTRRLGAGKGDADEIKKHSWFKPIDWDLAMKRGLKTLKPTLRAIPISRLSPEIFVDRGEDTDRIENWTIIDNSAN